MTGAQYNLVQGSITDAWHVNILTNKYTLTSGQDLAAGTPVGVVTATGKLVASDSTATNGSQNPIGILPIAQHADGADLDVDIIVQAEAIDFNKLEVTDLTWTVDTLKVALATRNIHIKSFLSGKGAD